MTYITEDIVNELIHMRLVDMASVKTCLEHIANKYGYKQDRCYKLFALAQKQIKVYYTDKNRSALEESIGQLENLAQEAKSTKQYKLAFEIRKELNNIEGLAKTKSEPLEVKPLEIRIIYPDGKQ